MSTISFKPKQVTKKITSHLQDRASDVIMNRFGLNVEADRKTLEEIGKKYNITRERVRQIEDVALKSIKKSEAYKGEQAVFDELKQLTNMRASGTDDAIFLKPAFVLNIERALEVMNEDEYVEITPKSVRIRKKYLTELERVRAGRS